MKHTMSRARAGDPGDRGGDKPMDTGAAKDTTAAPNFQQLVAQHQRSTLWRYQIRDLPGELTMVSTTPLTRAEAEKSIRMHFGDRLRFLRPGGGDE